MALGQHQFKSALGQEQFKFKTGLSQQQFKLALGQQQFKWLWVNSNLNRLWVNSNVNRLWVNSNINRLCGRNCFVGPSGWYRFLCNCCCGAAMHILTDDDFKRLRTLRAIRELQGQLGSSRAHQTVPFWASAFGLCWLPILVGFSAPC